MGTEEEAGDRGQTTRGQELGFLLAALAAPESLLEMKIIWLSCLMSSEEKLRPSSGCSHPPQGPDADPAWEPQCFP